MFHILVVDKSGQLSTIKTANLDNLYKKANLKTEAGFIKHCQWNVTTKEYPNLNIDFYGKKVGKATYENKYEFPPPIENQIFFGKCLLVAYTKTPKITSYVSLTEVLWQEVYCNLYSLGDLHVQPNTKKIFIKPEKNKEEELNLSSSENDEDYEEEDDEDDEEEEEDTKEPETEPNCLYGNEGLELVEELYFTDSDEDEDDEDEEDEEDEDEEDDEDEDEEEEDEEEDELSDMMDKVLNL